MDHYRSGAHLPRYDRPTDRQMDSMPKYASRYIRQLEQALEAASRKLAPRDERVAGSNVVTYDYINPERGIGKDAQVRFYLGGTHKEENSVCVNHNGPYELEVTTSGPGRLTFQPVSGNVMRVTLADR